MDHTHIVQANELENYADTRASEGVVLELIYLLVEQSVPNASERRIPYGDAVNQPGWDGRVVTEDGFAEFVPAGQSYWEIGTNADPQAKATAEFRKRTEKLSEEERKECSFIFVTPRTAGSGGWDEPAQKTWRERRKDQGWKEIRIIDGVKLADWLRHFPVLGCWMAKKMGLSRSLGGLTTPASHWELATVSVSGDPPLPAKLFTEGRDNACEALQALFEGQSQRLPLFAESPQDVFDFVAGYLEGLNEVVRGKYANRCLFVSEEDAWRSVVGSRKAHVLVADRRLELESDDQAQLQTMAIRKGHAVVVPLCGSWSNLDPAIIRLRSPSQSQIEHVLRAAGFSDVRSRELASIGGDRLSALRRHFLGLGTLPPYATWENARLFSQAGLAGKWNAKNQSDLAAMEMLLGKAYGEWIEILRTDVLRSDAPLIQRDERWRIVVRGEAWTALGSRITDDDLDRFQGAAVAVLGERDPSFDLPKEQRFAAAVHGKQLRHSTLIRDGLAETLALLGSRPESLSTCSRGKPETVAILTVRQLLSNAAWDRWASLNRLMPLLAEAAPDEFLDAVEAALVDLKDSPFHRVFAEEGGGIGTGGTYMSGLLWALETLAWSPDFLSRVAVILADLASIDPGGQYTNRPSRSLLDIFLPWHFQTCAPFDKRKAAVEAVLRERPEVGWTFLLGLLPHSHGFTTGSRQPAWRSFVPRDWKDGVLASEYWAQIETYVEFALGLAKGKPERLEKLIERFPDLHSKGQEALLEHLGSEPVLALPEAERMGLSEKLIDLVLRHRKYADAQWAMPEEILVRFEARAFALAPTTPDFTYRRLFNKHDFDLFDERGNYEEQRKRVDDARQRAVKTILDAGGVAEIRAFARNVSNPGEVGNALGKVATVEEVDSQIVPSLLDAQDEIERRFVAGFVWARCRTHGWGWVNRMLGLGWDGAQKSAFLLLLPFEEETWRRAADHLGTDGEGDYWRSVGVNPYGPDRDLSIAIQRLIEHGRADAAIHCISTTINRTPGFDADLAVRALLAVLETPSLIERVDHHATVEVIKALQATPDVDLDVLFKIEWYFLPWLDRFSEGSPNTLENRLASDPEFFAEVVALVYRSRISDATQEEPNEQRQALARNAYGLLQEWCRCPGWRPDGSLDGDAFNDWIAEAKRLTKESGHSDVAQIQIGNVLLHAPPDPDGLWIHAAAAATLNERDAEQMRSGFTTALFNSRGVHTFTAGKEESELAELNRKKADALDERGYTRFAAAMREFAMRYEREAQREAERDPFEDW